MFFLIITMLIKYKRKFKNETSFNAQVKKINLAMNVYIHFFSFF